MTAMPRILALALAVVLACAAAHAQGQPLVCSADPPVAGVGEAVTLQAWTDAGDVAWQVSEGRLEGSGSRRLWRLPGRTGRVTAGATSAGLAPCALTVFVVSDSRAVGGRESGTMFLVRGQAEPAGYGLYSYFLLGAPPDEQARERVLKSIDAFLKTTPSLAALEAVFERGELNANQMPVDAPAPDRPSAQWILEHYDYVRARAILARIDGSLRKGPYLVSVLETAGTRGPMPAPLLLQDLSTVPAHLVGDWYRLFLDQAAQEQFWESRRLEAVGVRMRTIVGVLAEGLPEVQGAVKQWVKWSK
ncbi:hypothetical protein [Variovorax saccharolyticus]|uniref:hypothetical protein n=1 Tax=Variovorax saccharolyticus TaxID=3053516 RepID=UPI0025772BD3|nr:MULTISPECIES: hypothetical protein [unclassified Variovorax]MDM0021094.1 hypothetical protein [Variovorax sp. J22R187]MDM0025440.1 hypothetical protein [Variovorax sp. J31P216]